jgi:bromodomain-containing factor 1
MKRELAQKIVSFEGENLERAIDIIRQGRPELLSDANKEIELDIDTLDASTLLNLYRFVCPTPVAAGRKGKGAGGAGRGGRNGAATAPSKRKNLDEIKESERIEMLEARLREFDGRTNASAGPTPTAAEGAAAPGAAAPGGPAAGGDQASSDSSSEDESGSDSDDD